MASRREKPMAKMSIGKAMERSKNSDCINLSGNRNRSLIDCLKLNFLTRE
jgi:hypothetical protein